MLLDRIMSVKYQISTPVLRTRACFLKIRVDAFWFPFENGSTCRLKIWRGFRQRCIGNIYSKNKVKLFRQCYIKLNANW